MNLIIGSYGPESVRIGNLALLPDEARLLMKESEGRLLRCKKDLFGMRGIYFWGDDYGQVIARCVKLSSWYFEKELTAFTLE